MSRELTVVTNSELGTFRSCPNLHHLKYRRGLRPKVRARPLAVGGTFHDAVAAGYGLLLRPSDDVRHLVRDAQLGSVTSEDDLVRMMAEAAAHKAQRELERWFAQLAFSQDDADFDEIKRDSEATLRTVDFMVRHFFEATRADLRTRQLVEVERAFRVPVRDAIGRPGRLYFAGVRDAVWYDARLNQLVLDEHKTTANDVTALERRMEMDPQTTGYQYALREALRAGELSVDGVPVPEDASVTRVCYNVVRKSAPREPRVNKDGTVSAALVDTTAAVYQRALDEQVHVRGKSISEKQMERLAQLQAKGDTYFARLEYHRTDAELERWRWETYTDAARMRAADRDPRKRTRNTGNCNMPWSLPCVYRGVCLDPDAPEYLAEFNVARARHTEVLEAEEQEN